MNELKGIEQVIGRLRKVTAQTEGLAMKGLIDAAIIVRRDMDETPPLIPVDTGNLRSSWFTSPFYSKGRPGVVMGFTANYAVFVHEMVDRGFESSTRQHINWNRPGSGPKFFEASLKRNIPRIMDSIKKNAQIR